MYNKVEWLFLNNRLTYRSVPHLQCHQKHINVFCFLLICSSYQVKIYVLFSKQPWSTNCFFGPRHFNITLYKPNDLVSSTSLLMSMHFNVFFFLSIKEIKQISICVQARDLKKSIQTLRNWATNQKEPQQLLIYKLHQYHVPRVISELCGRLNAFVFWKMFFIIFVFYESLKY